MIYNLRKILVWCFSYLYIYLASMYQISIVGNILRLQQQDQYLRFIKVINRNFVNAVIFLLYCLFSNSHSVSWCWYIQEHVWHHWQIYAAVNSFGQFQMHFSICPGVLLQAVQVILSKLSKSASIASYHYI